MQAKDVHSLLIKDLTPVWKAHGFRRLPGAPSTWYIEGGQEFGICRIYLDRHFGYTKPLGGRMFLRSWSSEWMAKDPEPRAKQLTLGDLLPTALLARASQVHRMVTRKIVEGDWGAIMNAADTHGGVVLTNMKERLRSEETWGDEMRYLDAEDVAAWTGVLREAAPELAAKVRSYSDVAAG